MGLRFRKSIKLAPGIRMNFSGSGISWSLGPRGASIGIGKRGAFLNTGIPGTGLYARQHVGSERTESYGHTSMSVTIGIAEDGTVYFQDDNGNSLPENLISRVKKQNSNAIRELICKKCNEINTQVEALGEIHIYTLSPNVKPKYEICEFQDLKPTKPLPKKLGFLGVLFKSRKEKIQIENMEKDLQYEEALKKWQYEKERFHQHELLRKEMIEHGIYTDVETMEDFLEENFQSIVWPRETIVSTEILDGGKRVFVDVDLPEIGDMPNKTASAPQRGYKLSVKTMSETQVQRLYMRHVHGVGFRIIGETFAALPIVQEVVLSTFSQRPDRLTGHLKDEYLYSVSVDRNKWSLLNFNNLQDLDIVEVLTQFNLKRNMTKSGAFKAIEPFDSAR